MTKEELEARQEELIKKIQHHHDLAIDADNKRREKLRKAESEELTETDKRKAEGYLIIKTTHLKLIDLYYIEWLEVVKELLQVLSDEIEGKRT